MARRTSLAVSGVSPFVPAPRACRSSVSSPLRLARSVRISRTTRSCTLHARGYETYHAGAAFVDRMVRDAVLTEESEFFVQPSSTPPLPAEASALTGSAQVAPDLLLYPVSDAREASTRVPVGEVVDPATQDRIDLGDHLSYRPRRESAEDVLELARCSLRPLLSLRNSQRHPPARTTADSTKLKAQKSKALALR